MINTNYISNVQIYRSSVRIEMIHENDPYKSAGDWNINTGFIFDNYNFRDVFPSCSNE
jgi:hypothetical protein